MSEDMRPKLKICLVGENSVGKTSLIKKYVYDEFDDKYITTLGAKITKKQIRVPHPKTGEEVDVILLIWDIMGQKGFRHLLQEAYFYGAQGIIGVCDSTREETLLELSSWMSSVQDITGVIPSVFLGNKCDLEEDREVGLIEIKSFASGYKKSETFLSSAKTGENVDSIFSDLSRRIIREMS